VAVAVVAVVIESLELELSVPDIESPESVPILVVDIDPPLIESVAIVSLPDMLSVPIESVTVFESVALSEPPPLIPVSLVVSLGHPVANIVATKK
jgi:hypothetical protein